MTERLAWWWGWDGLGGGSSSSLLMGVLRTAASESSLQQRGLVGCEKECTVCLVKQILVCQFLAAVTHVCDLQVPHVGQAPHSRKRSASYQTWQQKQKHTREWSVLQEGRQQQQA